MPLAKSPPDWLQPQNTWAISYERYGIAPEISLPSDGTSLLDTLEQCLHTFAERDAYICAGEHLSYAQFDTASLKIATYLQQLGLKKGDTVAVMLPNILQYPVIALGVIRAGLTLVNVNPQYSSTELADQLIDAQIKGLFILEQFLPIFHQAQFPPDHPPLPVIICQLGDMLGKVKGYWANLSIKHQFSIYLQQIPKILTSRTSSAQKPLAPNVTYRYFNQVITQTNPRNYQRPTLALSDIALLQYTGGTTGVAKGAMLTHGNLLANLLQIDALMVSAFPEDSGTAFGANILGENSDIVLTALPLYHIFAFTLCGLYVMYKGYTGLLIPNPRDMSGLIKQVKRYTPSFILGVNTLFNGLLEQRAFRELDFSALKATIGGGMSIMPAVANTWHIVTGTPIVEGYGLSETAPVVTFNPLTIAKFTQKIGIPAPSTDIQIIDDMGKAVAVGERGEIVVKGPQVMAGYWQRELDTKLAFTKNGYFKTGDIGIMDEQGFIKIVDRKKDMLLVSGFNVYPHEIEEVVSQHPDVAECAVIGIPNTVRGEEPKLYIVRKLVKNQPSVSEAEILDYARARLTGYKRPRSVQFVEKLPKSNVGKILRKELRKMEGLE